MEPTPGARLGHYEILGPLGAGGMGRVFRARDVKLVRRPRFFVMDQRHELGIAQREGVSWDDVHRFLQLVGIL